MSESVYLGVVKWVSENDKNYRHAIVEPLAESSEDRKRWIEHIENAVVQFPARGYVYWHNAPNGLTEGDIRQFEVEDHPHYKGELDRDALQVSNPKAVVEIIDLRKIGPESDIRTLLTTTGIFLKDRPLDGPCILWVRDEKWVGPVYLVPAKETGFWVLSSEQNLESIKHWKIPLDAIQRMELNGTRYLLAPNHNNLGQPSGFVNWQFDKVLAKRVLDHLRKHDRKTAEALKISKDIFRMYLDKIEQAGLVGANLAQELAFHERIGEILGVISKNEELLDEAASICFDAGPVKEKLEKKVEEEYRKKLTEAETRVDENLADRKNELENILGTLSEKRGELALVEEQIGALDDKLKERTAGFEEELEEKLRDLAEKPERLFAEMAIVNALVRKGGPTRSKPRPAVQRQTAADSVQITEESSAFMGALSTRLLALRISPVVGQELHSSLLAGMVPVLIGPEAFDVVSSYAACVSGGTLHWIPVGGSLYEPSDLLARFDPISRCLVPHPGGLLDLLLDKSDAMHVVVLDGFNRAAVEGYLSPLMQSAQDVARERKPRSIPVAPLGYTSEDDMYAGVSHIAWNGNVLLVLCPCTGASTLPLPEEFWAHGAVIYAGNPAPVDVTQEIGSISRTTRVPAAVWKAWLEGAKEKRTPLEMLRKLPKEAGALPPIALGNVERIYGSGMSLGLKPERALEQAVKTSLFPYLVASEGPVDAWFQHLGLTLNEVDRKIDDTVRRLGG